MKLINALVLFGAGYIYHDTVKPKAYSYYPNKNGNRTLRQYFKNLAMDKMDALFYAKTGKRNDIARKAQESSMSYCYPKIENTESNDEIPTLVDPLFKSRDDAYCFLNNMMRNCDRYGNVTLNEFYSSACASINFDEFPERTYANEEYGWTKEDFESAHVVCRIILDALAEFKNVYRLEMPEIREL